MFVLVKPTIPELNKNENKKNQFKNGKQNNKTLKDMCQTVQNTSKGKNIYGV